LGERVADIHLLEDGVVEAETGERENIARGNPALLHRETGLYGRPGAGQSRIQFDSRGRIKVNDQYQTDVPHIYAVGDVIGSRLLQARAWNREDSPHATHTEPRLTQCRNCSPLASTRYQNLDGRQERTQLTAEGIPYESGIAQYKEIARGQIIGMNSGCLKLLIHEENRRYWGCMR